MANEQEPKLGPVPAGYSVGVTEDKRFVTLNIPPDAFSPGYTLVFTPEQADRLADLLRRGALMVNHANSARLN